MRSTRIRGYKRRDGTFVGGHERSDMRGSAPDRHASPEAANAAKAAASAAASDPLALSDYDRDPLSDSAIKLHDQRIPKPASAPLPDAAASARREVIVAEERAADTAVRLGVDPEAARRTARRRAENAAEAASDPVAPDDALMVDDLASWETREIEAVMDAIGDAYDKIDSLRDDNCTPAAFRATDQIFESYLALRGEMGRRSEPVVA